MKMKKTYAKLLIFMAMAAALIGCPPTEEAVKISFSANGGVGTMAEQDATVGMETTLNANEFDRAGYEANEFDRAGYEFDGWNEAADGSGKSYADKGKITVSAAVKLYAQWKPAPLQNFEAVGANAAVILTWDLVQIPYEEISITYDGASEAVKVTPQNEPNDTVTISGLENDKEYTFTAVVTADGKTSRAATAKGTPSLANSPVTVTFHSNPPANLEEQDSYTQVVTVDVATALESCTFAYDSYEFKGWAESPDATEKYADRAELTATVDDIDSGIDLYAVWAGIPLTGVTIPSPAGYLIGGTTVVLEEALDPPNAYVSRVEVTAADSEETVKYDFDIKTLTLPSNTGDASVKYNLTLTYYTVNDSGEETPVSASLSDLTVYPDTWVVRNGDLYKDVMRYETSAFANDTYVTYANNDNGAIRRGTTTEGAVIDVSALANENNTATSNASITFKGVKSTENTSPTDPVLMELTVVYSDTSNIGAVLALPGENTTPWFWLLRNTFEGSTDNGTAFRVGEYSAAEGAKYTVPADEPFTLGYLFDGADNTNDNTDLEVKFFFNGENKFVPLTNDSRPSDGRQNIQAPSITSDVTLYLWKESNSTDPATMTIQEAVFYELAEAASSAAG